MNQAEDRRRTNLAMKLGAALPRLHPPPLLQATGKLSTTLKHQEKYRVLPPIRSHQHHSHTVNGSGSGPRQNLKNCPENSISTHKKKEETKLLGARSRNSKLPWPLLTKRMRRKDQGAKRDGQGAAATKEEELP
ncbi:hypothetical protein ACOSQ2_019738 [Xanthoceras sorbifolium]